MEFRNDYYKSMRRINWILILQAWAMLWVVTGHSSLYDIESTDNPYWEITIQKMAYSFHMALFIFVSGYLFHMTRIRKSMPYGKMIVDKLVRLGIPFIVFTLLAMLLKVLVSSEMSRQTTFSIIAFINAIFIHTMDL